MRATLVFFEGGSRLAASLADMAAVLGPREAVVCRELTKLYETIYRGALGGLAVDPKLNDPKGEIVILIAPGREAEASQGDIDTAIADALTRLRPGEAATEVAQALGLSRREVYQRLIAMRAGE
jgi:16S rRNA (cytidine1402-2'-O)-methyltransferase